jgi:hypothetical protein
MIFAGETEVLGENLPSATLSTTNPTCKDPGANPGLRGERPATNRLSHGTACVWNSVHVITLLTAGKSFCKQAKSEDGGLLGRLNHFTKLIQILYIIYLIS